MQFLLFTFLSASTAVILQSYEKNAAAANPTFKGFSAERGREFYMQEEPTKNGKISCSTCHTPDPRKTGRTRANKDIEPISPSVTPTRLTDSAKVEKWFKRNCDDVFKRPCTAQEKGDFITYLLSIK